MQHRLSPGNKPANVAANESQKRQQIVGTQKGKGGGYFLRRAPEAITFGEVIRALDGPLAAVPCVSRTAYMRQHVGKSEAQIPLRPVVLGERRWRRIRAVERLQVLRSLKLAFATPTLISDPASEAVDRYERLTASKLAVDAITSFSTKPLLRACTTTTSRSL